MVGSEYFSIPTSPIPSPPMSALNFVTDKSQQHQPTNCSDASMILLDPGPTWLDCNLQQKDALSAPWSSHYDHHSRGESHSEQLLAATGSLSSSVLRVEQWDRNRNGQSKFYSFNAPEISYPKCTSTDSGSCSSPSPTKTKCPANDTDWDDLEANIDLPKEMEAEETPTMTPAEIHQQKRKMKRFRLTHQQTRYLMSEFSRQSHPDAADRERLAREIPGLSPRQVQVWFQNRRAKLKRLTSDDRERMMLSRALPVHFDTAQTLHPPYPAMQSFTCSHSPPVRPAQMDVQEGINGLANTTILPHTSMNAHGSTMNFGQGAGDQNFTQPLSISNTLSPISPTGDGVTSSSPIEGAYYRYHNTRVASLSSPTNFSVQLHQPRLQIEERIQNTQPQSTTGPPRNSLPPYVGAVAQNDESIPPQRLEETIIPGTESTGQYDPAASHQLRFSYPRLPTYHTIHGFDLHSRSNGSRDLNIHTDVTSETGPNTPLLYQPTSFATPHII